MPKIHEEEALKPARLTFLVLLLALTAAPEAQAVPPIPDADFPLLVQVSRPGAVDYIWFADHTNSPMEGNWITLGGGTNVDLPQVKMKYSGVTQATYTRGSSQVSIATYNLNGRLVQYPPSTHQTHTPTQTVTYTFRGDADFAGRTVSVRLIPVTATSLRDAASDAFLGDTATLKSILSSHTYISSEKLNSEGDIGPVTIGALPSGDYILVIVDETPGNPYYLYVYSATAIEVLDYASTVTVPSSVTRGNDLSIQVQLSGAGAASRRYGAVIIQQSKYSADLKLTSDGTTEGTSLTGRGATLVEGTTDSFKLAGITIDGLDKDQLISKLNEAYDGSEFSTGFTDYTTATQGTVQVTTTGLNAGKFVVLVGVWEGAGDKLVAFYQRVVTISGPPAPMPGPPLPSTAAGLQAMGDAEAAAALAAMGPANAASLMNQLTAGKAAGIIGRMPTANAAAIVNLMQTGAAAAAMNVAENGVVARILAAVDKAKAVAIMSEMNVGSVAGALEEAVGDGKAAQFSGYMNALDPEKAAKALLEMDPALGARIVEGMAGDDLHEAAMRVEAAVKLRLGESDPAEAERLLNRIAETLENADTGALVDIFMEIANLPETPKTVATVLEAMSPAKALDVVSTWIGVGGLDELGKVLSHFSGGFLSDVWRGLSAAERSTVWPHLAQETVQSLPEVGEFQLSMLGVSPAAVAPGQTATVSVVVENVGADPALYTVVLRINGAAEASRRVTMLPGESQTLQWAVSRIQVGTYAVDVNGLTGSLAIQSGLAPAEFTLSGLTVSPATVEPGDPVTVTVAVRNTGGERGSTTVELKVGDATEDTEQVTLDAGASTTVSFTVTRSAEGAYAVAVGSLVGGFTVAAPEAPPPGVPWAAVLAAVVVVSAVGFYIYTRRPGAPRGGVLTEATLPP